MVILRCFFFFSKWWTWGEVLKTLNVFNFSTKGCGKKVGTKVESSKTSISGVVPTDRISLGWTSLFPLEWQLSNMSLWVFVLFSFSWGVRRLMMKTRLTHVDELISTVFPHQVHKIIHLNHVNKVPVKNLHWKAFQSGCSWHILKCPTPYFSKVGYWYLRGLADR